MGNTVSDITRAGIVCFGYGATGNTIYDNTVSNCGWGIVVHLGSSATIDENTISDCVNAGINCNVYSYDNIVTDNSIKDGTYYGIHLYYSSSNTVSGNYIEDHQYYGIYSYYSSANTISGNEMVNNGINMWGNSVSYWNTHTIDTTNTVNDKPVIYWKDVDGGTVPKGAGQVILANCENVKVTGQDIEYASQGIGLGFCSECVVSDNTVANSVYDIIVAYGSDNLVSNNEINCGNIDWGIYLMSGSNNQVSDNCVSGGNVGIRTYDESSSEIKDNEVEGSFRCIAIFYSSNLEVYDNSADDGTLGINLYGTHNSVVKKNKVSNSLYGIRLYNSNYNTIKENTLIKNTYPLTDVGGVDNIIEDNKVI
jgi:parallel beta-helix repeat protein